MPLPTMLLLYRFWLGEICICCKPCPTWRRDAWLTNCTPNDSHVSVFLYFWYSTRKIHSHNFQTLRVGHFACHFLFLLVLLWKEFNSHSFVDTLHFSHSLSSLPVIFYFFYLFIYFLSNRGWLLNSRKRQLFHLHIQHAMCCLFEWQTQVSSSEAAVCGFCLSILLHNIINWTHETNIIIYYNIII